MSKSSNQERWLALKLCNGTRAILCASILLQPVSITIAPASQPAETSGGAETTGSKTAAGDPRVEDVSAAWRRRADTLETARFQWRERHVYTTGSIIAPEETEGLGFPADVAQAGVPQNDLVQEFDNELLLEGTKMRFVTQQPTISGDGKVSFTKYTSSFDGASSRMLSQGGRGDDDLNAGRLVADSHNTDARAWPLMPLMIHLVPLRQDGFGAFEAGRWRISDRDVIVDGTACLHLENGFHHVWVDPERECSVLRWQLVYPNGRISLQADIAYQPDQDLGTVPRKWKIDSFTADGTGRVEHSVDAEVTSYRLGAKVSAKEFSVEFPANTHVVDEVQQNEFVIDGAGRAGPRVPIGEIQRAEYDRTRPRYWLVAILVVAICVAVAVLRMRFKRSRAD